MITCFPNFPKGKIFGGYKNKPWSKETIDGIEVVRVMTFVAPNKGFFLRTLDFLSFMVAAVLASFFIRKPDIIVGTSPQFFTGVAAHFVARLKRVPWVFEVRDLWPESLLVVGVLANKRTYRILSKVELFLYEKADHITVVSAGIRDSIIARGISVDKISVITNGVLMSTFQALKKDNALSEELGLSKKFVVGYIGTHGMAHHLSTVLEAADIAQTSMLNPNVHFLFVGDGADKLALVGLAKSKKLRNVTFVDNVTRSDIARFWSILDVSLVHLKRHKLFLGVIPSKIFESMAAGVPILHGVEGESADIVTKYKAGIVFQPEDAESLVRSIKLLSQKPQMLKDLQLNSRLAAKKFSRANLASAMLSQIKKVVSHGK